MRGRAGLAGPKGGCEFDRLVEDSCDRGPVAHPLDQYHYNRVTLSSREPRPRKLADDATVEAVAALVSLAGLPASPDELAQLAETFEAARAGADRLARLDEGRE